MEYVKYKEILKAYSKKQVKLTDTIETIVPKELNKDFIVWLKAKENLVEAIGNKKPHYVDFWEEIILKKPLWTFIKQYGLWIANPPKKSGWLTDYDFSKGKPKEFQMFRFFPFEKIFYKIQNLKSQRRQQEGYVPQPIRVGIFLIKCWLREYTEKQTLYRIDFEIKVLTKEYEDLVKSEYAKDYNKAKTIKTNIAFLKSIVREYIPSLNFPKEE
jgi:hypothetical protein